MRNTRRSASMARVDPELWVLAHGGYTRVYEWPPEIRWFITEEVIREFAERGLCGDDARRAVAAIAAAWAADRFPADEPSVASALQGWDYTTVDTTAESEVAEILGAGVASGLYRDPPPAQDPAVVINTSVTAVYQHPEFRINPSHRSAPPGVTHAPPPIGPVPPAPRRVRDWVRKRSHRLSKCLRTASDPLPPPGSRYGCGRPNGRSA